MPKCLDKMWGTALREEPWGLNSDASGPLLFWLGTGQPDGRGLKRLVSAFGSRLGLPEVVTETLARPLSRRWVCSNSPPLRGLTHLGPRDPFLGGLFLGGFFVVFFLGIPFLVLGFGVFFWGGGGRKGGSIKSS